jgi:hypothetical protein
LGVKASQRDENYRNAVEYLCTHLKELETEVEAKGAPDDRLTWRERLKALAAADGLSEPWYAAVRELHAIVDRAGIPGGIGLSTPMGGRWPGPTATVISGWACPKQGMCTRIEVHDSAAADATAQPECRLLGRAMRPIEA